MILYLYRKWRQAVTLAAVVAVLPAALGAQWGAPLPERKTARAVAVLESYANGTRRLVPVTFYYEQHYYDATFYRATPVPLALDSETVYEVQRFGQPLGTFTVQSASQRAAAWIGEGRFRRAPDAAALARKKAAARVVLVDPSRPVLHRRAGSEGDRPVAAASPTPSADEDDPDRPVLRRPEDEGAGKPAADQSVKPAAKQGGAGVAGAGAAPEADGDAGRPILRRGKPVEEQSGADLPELNPGDRQTGGKPGSAAGAPVVREVAVSDAGPSQPEEVLFACSQPQRQQMEASARSLAQAELRRVASMRGLLPPEEAKAGAVKAEAAFPRLTMEDEQFVLYDLDYHDYATVVFSARYRPTKDAGAGATGNASLPAAGAWGNASLPAAGAWVVTVIARQDGDRLVKLYSAVSDPKALDLYPEVRLVDAVDPDGYGRFALLFREQKGEGVSWLLGRVTGYELETLFETAER